LFLLAAERRSYVLGAQHRPQRADLMWEKARCQYLPRLTDVGD
jgi:hypothetical protein